MEWVGEYHILNELFSFHLDLRISVTLQLSRDAIEDIKKQDTKFTKLLTIGID